MRLPVTNRRPATPHSRVSRAAMDVNDDVLGLVLERVHCHVSLIRAAAVCKRWRRAIADAAFLLRFRSLHTPPVAGYYRKRSYGRLGGSMFVPSSPSVMDARHFSLDFLPGVAGSWIVEGSRGSLLLLCSTAFEVSPVKFLDKVVCEPLTRRYTRIHPPAGFDGDGCYCCESYLIDGEANEAGGGISMSNFRVLCMFDCDFVTHPVMYTVGSSWIKKSIDHRAPSFEILCPVGHGGGCWYFIQGRALIILDGSTGDFSSDKLPPLLEDWDSQLLHQ